MTDRPGGRVARALVPVALSAALASAPTWGVAAVASAQSITPEQAAAAGYIPNPAPALASISIDEVSPRVLDGSAPAGGGAIGTDSGIPLITVSGTITNVGDTPLEAVDVRLQRGPRASDATAVRDPLVWSEPSFGLRGEFQRVTESLGPGESITYSVSMPARDIPGQSSESLQLTEPGVYPLLVNVNGTPEGGGPARLDDERTLLPVLEVPRAPADPDGSGGPGGTEPDRGDDDDEVPAAGPADEPGPLPASVPLTVLWPLASAPTRISPVPGVEGPDPVVMLTDGSLLDELSESGRLTGLVRAAEEAFSGTGGAELRRATCLAVDPDLVATVADIADGEKVLIDGSDDLGGGPADSRDRSGDSDGDAGRPARASEPDDPAAVAADAARWLDEVRAVAESGCLVTLPAAQADLDEVARVGSPLLTGAALDRPGSVERILGVEPQDEVLLPASGTLEPGTATALSAEDATAIVAAPSTRTDIGVVPSPGMVGIAGTQGLRALTYSSALGSALAATGAEPENPRYSDPSTRYWLTADAPASRLQDALAGLLAPVIDVSEYATPTDAAPTNTEASSTANPVTAAPAPGTPADSALTHGVLAVPPQVWTIDGTQAESLLSSLSDQLTAGRMRALPLADRLAGPVTVPDGSLADFPTSAADPGDVDPFDDDPAGTTDRRLASVLEGVGTLHALIDTSDPTSAGATGHLAPLVGDALRAISETGRRAGGDGMLDSGTGTAARLRVAQRLERLGETVTASLGRVDLLPPGSVFTMASPNSPLLLVIRNQLPFPVRVRVEVTAPEGLTVDPGGPVQVPASGSRTLQVPTQSEYDDGGRHIVSFSLTGPDGTPLAEPVELSVQTGGYPVAQAFAIAAAALALVLFGRRFLRYRRGILDPADEGHRP